MCELLYAGKTLKEIAGYDDAFMQWVLCRPRDEYGKLFRRNPNLPWWVTTDSNGQWRIRAKDAASYSDMFKDVLKHRGLDEQQRQIAFDEWKRANPKFGKGGEF